MHDNEFMNWEFVLHSKEVQTFSDLVSVSGFLFFCLNVVFFFHVLDWVCCWWHNKCFLRIQPWYACICLFLFLSFFFVDLDFLMIFLSC